MTEICRNCDSEVDEEYGAPAPAINETFICYDCVEHWLATGRWP